MIRGVLIWFCVFVTCSFLTAEVSVFELHRSKDPMRAVASDVSRSPLRERAANCAGLPDYLDVLDTLLALYNPDLPENDYLSISRQPTGYYVGVNHRDEVYPRQFFPFWLEGDTRPRPLSFRKRGNSSLPHYATETAGYWKAQQFDRHLYYGYPDFTKDVFDQLDRKADLSTRETQQLARAHAEHAMNLLNNQFGTSDPAARFKLEEKVFQQLNTGQLNSYLAHLNRAVALYGQLPFETPTPVGDAGTKYSHTIMAGYLTLLQYSDAEVARKFLMDTWNQRVKANQSIAAEVGYDEHLLFSSRLLLESCPTDAVLITEGDNDTYPLLYLQLIENFRPDILIVNRHLLHLPRYVNVLRKGVQPGGKMVLSQPEATIRNWQNERYLPGERAVLARPDEVKDILSRLSDLSVSEERPIARLPFGAIQLTNTVDGPLYRPEAAIFSLGDLVMLDLIATNYGNRPIAISVAINQAYFAYGNSWQQVGLIFNLGDEKPYYKIDVNGTIAWSALLRRSQPINYAGKQSRFYLKHLQELVIGTASYLDRLHEQQVAVELIDGYLSHLDRKELFNNFSSASLLRLMYRLGYDPSLISAYVGMIRETMQEIPATERGEFFDEQLGYLQGYLETGRFGAAVRIEGY